MWVDVWVFVRRFSGCSGCFMEGWQKWANGVKPAKTKAGTLVPAFDFGSGGWIRTSDLQVMSRENNL